MKFKSVLKLFVILVFLLTGGAGIVITNDMCKEAKVKGKGTELLYFPSGRFVREISLGFRNFAADLVWLQFIQYYGEHRMTDQKYLYLAHILDVMTTLDPKFIHAYTFGTLLLAHDAKEPEKAMKLVSKGTKENPESWEIPFIAGFVQYVFLRNYTLAGEYFAKAASKPNAPEICFKFAGYVAQKIPEDEIALKILSEVRQYTKNEDEKRIAKYYEKKYIMIRDLRNLNKIAKEYREKTGKFPDERLTQFVFSGFLKKIPDEPHGGFYFFDADSEKVRSSWKHKPGE